MLKIVNFSIHPSDSDKFSGDSNRIMQFLKSHELDGLEVIQHYDWEADVIPPSMIIGLHMRFWPIWLDFWRNDKNELINQFGDKTVYTHYYGGGSRSAIIDHYRKELKTAEEMGAQYVVFHVCHAQLEHCYNYKFTYSDYEVADAFIEMINEVMEGSDAKFLLLLENLWWPGLTFLDKNIAERLMDKITYPNKGFMLDTGHLMNTNLELRDEEEAVAYIMKVLKGLGEMAGHIKGIHLNSSLSGEYVKNQIACAGEADCSKGFFDRYIKAFSHISKIDRHMPFTHPSINAVIDFVKPQFLIHEFITSTLEEWDEYINTQNDILNPAE
ncbi:endonuclease 4 [Oxobacter pfennigii]|uniref:Endonuclease 4 n=1 Tax=Oxobacter pfennigii TaxID=36849 RepID=A0A0P8W415_9CLOT|nr:TIM barrel protein [Oxobacter pfennigii]KPU43330.1 endonuclease 4 [Oxobacter pfennigii]